MNSKPLWVATTVVALAAAWQLASAQADKENPAPKWEYKAVDGGLDSIPQARFTKELARLGDQGWELVAVEPATAYVQDRNIYSMRRIFHLKRPKQ